MAERFVQSDRNQKILDRALKELSIGCNDVRLSQKREFKRSKNDRTGFKKPTAKHRAALIYANFQRKRIICLFFFDGV